MPWQGPCFFSRVATALRGKLPALPPPLRDRRAVVACGGLMGRWRVTKAAASRAYRHGQVFSSNNFPRNFLRTACIGSKRCVAYSEILGGFTCRICRCIHAYFVHWTGG